MSVDQLETVEEVEGWLREAAQDALEVDLSEDVNWMLGEVAKAHAGYFENQTDPSGKAWPPLAPSTIQRKGHDRILHETGRLGRSLTTQKGSSDSIREAFSQGTASYSISFGTTVPYSKYLHKPNILGKIFPHVGIGPGLVLKFCERLVDAMLRGITR